MHLHISWITEKATDFLVWIWFVFIPNLITPQLILPATFHTSKDKAGISLCFLVLKSPENQQCVSQSLTTFWF